MKNVSFSVFLVFAVSLMLSFMAGCSDPASETPDAMVNDPVESSADASATSGADEATAEVNGKKFVLTGDSVLKFIGSKTISGSHEGGFEKVTGAVLVTEDGSIIADGPITIDMNSIYTDNEKLTGHLKNKDFFEVETWPTSTFTITSVAKEGETHMVTGNLEMHGVTKSITFPANVSVTDDMVSVKANFDINRKLWNINYDGMGDNIIRDNVVLMLDIKASPGDA